MSDPYLNCEHCGDQCGCRATMDEVHRYRKALEEIKAAAEKLVADEDGGHEQALQEFLVEASEKATAALAEPKA